VAAFAAAAFGRNTQALLLTTVANVVAA